MPTPPTSPTGTPTTAGTTQQPTPAASMTTSSLLEPSDGTDGSTISGGGNPPIRPSQAATNAAVAAMLGRSNELEEMIKKAVAAALAQQGTTAGATATKDADETDKTAALTEAVRTAVQNHTQQSSANEFTQHLLKEAQREKIIRTLPHVQHFIDFTAPGKCDLIPVIDGLHEKIFDGDESEATRYTTLWLNCVFCPPSHTDYIRGALWDFFGYGQARDTIQDMNTRALLGWNKSTGIDHTQLNLGVMVATRRLPLLLIVDGSRPALEHANKVAQKRSEDLFEHGLVSGGAPVKPQPQPRMTAFVSSKTKAAAARPAEAIAAELRGAALSQAVKNMIKVEDGKVVIRGGNPGAYNEAATIQDARLWVQPDGTVDAKPIVNLISSLYDATSTTFSQLKEKCGGMESELERKEKLIVSLQRQLNAMRDNARETGAAVDRLVETAPLGVQRDIFRGRGGGYNRGSYGRGRGPARGGAGGHDGVDAFFGGNY